METDVTISEWGNSLGIRIPKNIAEEIGAVKGGKLRMSTTAQDSLILSKPKHQRRWTIQELMANTTPEDYGRDRLTRKTTKSSYKAR